MNIALVLIPILRIISVRSTTDQQHAMFSNRIMKTWTKMRVSNRVQTGAILIVIDCDVKPLFKPAKTEFDNMFLQLFLQPLGLPVIFAFESGSYLGHSILLKLQFTHIFQKCFYWYLLKKDKALGSIHYLSK